MQQTYFGSCLCGAVTYELQGEFKRFFLCHCSRCQKTSGSAHCANLFAPQAELNWLSGKDKLSFYQVPETRFARTFCHDCGSLLPTEDKSSGLVVVPAGSLDSDVEIKPEAHIFCGSKANWDNQLESLPTFEGLPE